MTPAQWRLARRVEALIRREQALTDAELADRLGAAHADIRTVAAVLCRQGAAERCGEYLVPGPKIRDDRRPA